MFNKIYELIKKYSIFIIGITVGLFLAFFKLPYYIEAPGGVINIQDKIKIDNAYEVKGSFNMAYVSEYKATIPIFLIAKLNKDWTIEKKSDVLISNQTDKDIYASDRLLLQEANQNATLYAYKKAGKDIKINNSEIYVNYVYEEALTDLKIGDQIKQINDVNIDSKVTLLETVQKYNEGDLLQIKVINNNKEYNRKATIISIDGIKLIGIGITQIIDYETNPKIKFNISSSESGPSGGLMMSLSIYNYLTKEDITKGKRIAGTGTIDENGNVGSIGGVPYKIKGAAKAKIKYFLIPRGDNYEEALKIKQENNYDMEIVPISTFEEALDYLSSL